MKLIGSTTSPYVRRVRLLLEGQNYHFEILQIFSSEGSNILKNCNPTMRIPVLITDERTIFDSMIISEFLLNQRGIQLSIEEKLGLKLIDELCDAGIYLFQQKLWSIDPQWSNTRSKIMLERIELILCRLEKTLDKLSSLQGDWLFCVLDWLRFRSIVDWQKDNSLLVDFYQHRLGLKRFSDTSYQS